MKASYVEQLSRFLREDKHMSSDSTEIRIVHIVTRMNTGGVAVLLKNLLTNLDSEKFQVTLLVGSCDASEEDYLVANSQGIEYKRIPSMRKRISILSDIIALSQIINILRQLKPQIVHTHTSKAGLLGRIASFLVDPKTIRIHTYHGTLLEGYFNPFFVRVIIIIERFLALITHNLVAMGNQVKNDLLEIGVGTEKKFLVFFPGVLIQVYLEQEEARTKLGLDIEATYCTFVGRLTQVKRPDRLLQTIEEIKNRGLKVEFLVVGEGDLSEETQRIAASKTLPVNFLGWKNNVSDFWAASDIAILCSDNEAVSLVLIEASLAGIPIISTNVGAVSDVVIDGTNGLLTDVSAGALADAIEKLAKDPALRASMGAAGQKRSHELFSLARMISDHSQLYSHCMHGND